MKTATKTSVVGHYHGSRTVPLRISYLSDKCATSPIHHENIGRRMGHYDCTAATHCGVGIDEGVTNATTVRRTAEKGILVRVAEGLD